MNFETQVQYLKGVGPKLGEVLRRRGIETVGDLLHWYPRAYEDRRAARSVSSLVEGQIVSLVLNVISVRSMNLGRSRRKMYEVMVGDATGKISCKYFRVPYKGYFERFEPYSEVRVSGKVTNYRGRIEFHHPDIHPVQEGEENEDALIPLYTETEGIKPTKLRKILATAIHSTLTSPKPTYEGEELHSEILPGWVREKYNLVSEKKALTGIHQPDSERVRDYMELNSDEHRRLIFEEFFWLELHLARIKSGVKRESAPVFTHGVSSLDTVIESLPFELTSAQNKALLEVSKDLESGQPMHRLVQGDVGSGKTVVALLSCVLAKMSGYQSAIMAPTEILAEQHLRNSNALLEQHGIRSVLVTGSMTVKQRREVLQSIKNGEVDLVIGTHALIEDSVEFHNLGLVIVDEQHRFGVEQRNKLRSKGVSHFLVMTATPIPRTLAMTVYGDLDVSIINELPKGRSPIVTRKTFASKRDKVLQFMRDQIAKGRQVYFVYPLVEESDKIELKDAVSEYKKLQEECPDLAIGLLHGKMKSSEKEEVMTKFRSGEYQVLVSTTVIEVGVDVPNANLMIIEHCERFGLSQLHQLRGRVGRGEHKSYCVLILGYNASEEAAQRAEVMEKYTDGFKIAEEDLALRGPGEFLGTRQSGLAGFKMANLVRDIELLKCARECAFDIVAKDPELLMLENQRLRQRLEKSLENYVG